MKANATQQLLRASGIKFWGNMMFGQETPNLNPAEHVGTITKDEVKARMLEEAGPGRHSIETLNKNLNSLPVMTQHYMLLVLVVSIASFLVAEIDHYNLTQQLDLMEDFDNGNHYNQKQKDEQCEAGAMKKASKDMAKIFSSSPNSQQQTEEQLKKNGKILKINKINEEKLAIGAL
uniref:Uncharacterized protein n=1 Tax=Romanomermis culicivorax TaxID=13658 RepID=A0A915KK94_ROMCU